MVQSFFFSFFLFDFVLLSSGCGWRLMDNPLIEAIKHGSIDRVKEVLSSSPSLITSTAAEKQTALHIACSLPDASAELIALLLKAGCDANAIDRFQWTPLHCACRHGSPAAIRTLLDKPVSEKDIKRKKEKENSKKKKKT